MRGFIRFCALIFVIVGAFVVVGSFGAALIVAANPTIPEPGEAATSPILAGLMVLAFGVPAGATIALIGGATELLGSIDRRLELGATRAA